MTQKFKKMFYEALRIRLIEEEIALRYPQGKMRCPTHLSIGQEAVPVMLSQNLQAHDLMVGTHRSHAHYLAKGGSLQRFIAELYGKATGCTRGRGGSMNLSDLSVGFVASTAIVANTVPVGVGLAFSQQLKNNGALTCIFLGDAAVEEGAVYEALNFAVLKKLPVIFACENNRYSVNTPFALRQPQGRLIYEMARGMGAQVEQLDGNDIPHSFSTVSQVIEQVRKNPRAWFLEFETYRYKAHCGPEDDVASGRPAEELAAWLARDPLLLLQSYLQERRSITEDEISVMRSKIKNEIEEAFAFAEQSPFPAVEERFLYRYAQDDTMWQQKVFHEQPEGVQV